MRHFPQELVDETLEHLEDEKPVLQTCALVAPNWTPTSQRLLFRCVKVRNQSRSLGLRRALELSPHLRTYIKTLIITLPDLAGGSIALILAPILSMLKDVQTLHLLAEHRLFTRARPFGNLPDAFHAAMWEIMNTENFSCMVLANWDFSTTDCIPTVSRLHKFELVDCSVGRHYHPPNARFRNIPSSPLFNDLVMHIDTLEVRGCDGMNEIQAWIAKHTFTPNLVVDGVEEIRPQLLGGVHYFEVHLNDEVPNPELSFDKLDQMNCKYLLLHLDLIPENCKALLEPVFVWLGRARLNWGTYLRLELSASRRFPSGFCFCAKWELVKKAVEENGTLKVEAMEMKRRDETDEIEMHVLIRNK